MPLRESETLSAYRSSRYPPDIMRPTRNFAGDQHNEKTSSGSDVESEATDVTSLSTAGGDLSEISDAGKRNRHGDDGSRELESLQSSSHVAKCPAAQLELGKIAAAYPKLRATGCTAKFCQSGRMIKMNEPRVGRDTSVQDIQSDAEDFLRQLRAENIIDSDKKLEHRLNEVLAEIATSRISNPRFASQHEIEDPSVKSSIGGVWSQSLEELRHGLRLAWKHAQKCIMRSEYQTLEVRDLRHINTSQEMCTTLVAKLREAFNGGQITPTVFAFPPRQPGSRGPMFWNHQLLSFAAYEEEDGSILGDPANLQLTKDIIELGWCPSALKTRWDLLPIVAMAEGDRPYWTEITEEDFPLVRINHPQFELQFEKLGLRWVPAPALSRLGFDIGGVQYTAAPFIGWFMDAEIGVRDLADTFRYNALPPVAAALGWIESEHDLDRLPEYEKLAVLSRAQAELNFAVYHSFKTSKVAMSDTLSASAMYCTYDDEHFRTKGYRLPSNPYWLAPPQGSIVPVWHRGGAPNYQPSPLICKHVQDPVKAWRRQTRQQACKFSVKRDHDNSSPSPRSCSSLSLQDLDNGHDHEASDKQIKPRIHICFCSAASTAKKLASDLHARLRLVVNNEYILGPITALNDFTPSKSDSEDILLVIASTAGHGEMPLNGQHFLKVSFGGDSASPIRYSIFGNGSSLYGDRYNAAAKTICDHLLHQEAIPLGDEPYAGDTAKEEPPWCAFDDWYQHVAEALHVGSDSKNRSVDRKQASAVQNWTEVASSYSTAKIITCARSHSTGMQHIVVDIGDQHYETLSHISMIVPNDPGVVKHALRTIGLKGNEHIHGTHGGLSLRDHLIAFVDFDKPFLILDWTRGWSISRSQRQLLGKLPLREALEAFKWPWRTTIDLQRLLAAMPLKTPRMFSVASSQESFDGGNKRGHLDLLIQHRVGGLVSNYLQNVGPGDCVQLKTNPTNQETLVHDIHRPIICFAIGSGLAPVLSLLGHRMAMQTRSRTVDDQERLQQGSNVEYGKLTGAVTLILGFRKTDSSIIGQMLREAVDNGVVDMLLMTPSNDRKLRAQDRIFDDNVRQKLESKIKHEDAAVFVCALPEAAADFGKNLSALLGCNVQDALGDKYVEQVYKPAC